MEEVEAPLPTVKLSMDGCQHPWGFHPHLQVIPSWGMEVQPSDA